jgi:hypothetical protein
MNNHVFLELVSVNILSKNIQYQIIFADVGEHMN